MSFLENRS
jgi:ABC-type Zn2+ transport system, periplasmic component/surface adhesin